MAEITLGDYTGYLLLEMVRARELADAYSRSVAERYAADELLRFFSVPRFKVPKMELTVPVLISSARFNQTVHFDFPEDDFVAAIVSRSENVRTEVEMSRGGEIRRLPAPAPAPLRSSAVEKLARVLHAELVENPDPLRPQAIVAHRWGDVFRTTLAEARLLKYWEENEELHPLLGKSTDDVTGLVLGRTVVDRTEIENVLVDPQTNVVKNGSDPASVFTIKAELLEEGFYLRTVRDGGAEQETRIVEFE